MGPGPHLLRVSGPAARRALALRTWRQRAAGVIFETKASRLISDFASSNFSQSGNFVISRLSPLITSTGYTVGTGACATGVGAGFGLAWTGATTGRPF